MWEIPYIRFLILALCPSWRQTIWFGLLCAVIVFCVMWVAYRLRLRMIAKEIRVQFDERLAERTRVARELQETMLQTVQGSKFLADAALEKYNDSAHLRLTLEKLSRWLGQATQEGQAALNSLRSSTKVTNDYQSNRLSSKKAAEPEA
jgi:signal transduction histidine kinase